MTELRSLSSRASHGHLRNNAWKAAFTREFMAKLSGAFCKLLSSLSCSLLSGGRQVEVPSSLIAISFLTGVKRKASPKNEEG